MKQSLLTALLIVAVCVADGQDIYNKARVALDAKDTTVAYNAFMDAVKAGQKLTESNYYLGAISFHRHKYDDAVRFLQASVKADDENVEALTLLGRAYMEKRDMQNALTNLRMAKKYGPKNADAAVAYGLTLLAMDSIDAAIQALTQSTLLDQNNPRAYDGLGDAYMKQGVTVLGISNYQKSIELDPKNIDTRYKLARAYEKDKKYNEAVKEYRGVQDLDSTYADAFYQEASIWIRTGKVEWYKYAVPPLARLVKLRPGNFEGHRMYALALLSLDNPPNDSLSVKESQKALALDSSSQDVWRTYVRGLVAIKDGKRAEPAFKSMERRGKIEPDDYLTVAKLYQILGNEPKALEYFEAAFLADSTNCDPFFSLGSLYMKKQDFVKAAEMFERKITCDSRSLAAYLNAAACYMQVKNYPRTRELLIKCLELKPDFYQGHLWLARYYNAVDSLDKAVDTYDQILKLIGEPVPADKRRDAGEAWFSKAILQFGRKQYDRAVSSFQRALGVGYETDALQLSLGQAILQTLDQNDPEGNKKKVGDAEKAFRRSIQLDPKVGQSHFWLGQAIMLSREPGADEENKKKKEEACGEFQKSIRLDPKLKTDVSKSMNLYGCS